MRISHPPKSAPHNLIAPGFTRAMPGRHRLALAACAVAFAAIPPVAAAQSTPPIVIQPPGSAENPAPPPVTSTEVPPVTVDVPDRGDPQGVPARDTSIGVPGLGPDPSPAQAERDGISPRAPILSPGTPGNSTSTELPAPSTQPLAIDPETDPVLRTAFTMAPRDEFLELVRNAVAGSATASNASIMSP